MTYQQLLDWVKKQGKTEHELLAWFAVQEVEPIQEMTTMELATKLLRGLKVDRAYVEGVWNALDDEGRHNYVTYIEHVWNERR